MDPFVVVLAVLVMIVGMLGIVIPVLPGLLLVWLAAVVSTLLQGADGAGWALVAVHTVLFGVGFAATVVLPVRQGRQGGAAPASFGLAALGAVVGFFVIPVVGIIVGALLGLYLGERRRLGDGREAAAATGRVLRAYGVGVLVETAIGVTMIGIWVIALFARG